MAFRNPDKLQVLPFREWLRKHKPSGSDGFVVEDLDLVLRVYGKRYGSDDIGRFILLELKFGESWIGIAQEKTFGMIHRLLRRADPGKHRYLGYYVVQYNSEDWDAAEFRVNRIPVDRETFLRFLDLVDVGISGLWEATT